MARGLVWGQRSHTGVSPAHHPGRGCLQRRERLVDCSPEHTASSRWSREKAELLGAALRAPALCPPPS